MRVSVRSGFLGMLVAAGLNPLPSWAEESVNRSQGETFDYQERSTVNTIPFSSMPEESLANTVIEGGLAAPAAGIPVRAPDAADDFYLDPLAFQLRDSRTDLGRSEIPIEIRFSNQKFVPGQAFGNNYVIRPPENRTYDTLNTNLQDR